MPASIVINEPGIAAGDGKTYAGKAVECQSDSCVGTCRNGCKWTDNCTQLIYRILKSKCGIATRRPAAFDPGRRGVLHVQRRNLIDRHPLCRRESGPSIRGVSLKMAWVIAVAAAALFMARTGAVAQTTCFGKGSVLTCLDRTGGPAYQANCFGPKRYRSCTSATGRQFTLSDTPANANSSTTSGALQPPGTAGAIAGARPSTDPAFGRPSPSSNDPLTPLPATAPRK